MKLYYTLFFLVPTTIFAQVGINTVDPKATLDIVASSVSSPSNEDGILIPRIDQFPAINPGADQNAMLVYLTTADAGNAPGFYYWNQGISSWSAMDNAQGWDLNGNTGTSAATNFLGTTDAVDVSIRTDNTEFFRFTTKGQLETFNNNRSVFIGENAGENINFAAFGRRNIYIGENAGRSNLVRSDNVGIGVDALTSQTSGSASVAIGSYALESATNAQYSIAIGHGSGNNNLNSVYNTGVGHRTLSLSSTGQRNTALGADAGRTTAADDSVFIGYEADEENDGGQNVVIGSGAGIETLSFNSSGRVLIGYRAGRNQGGDNMLMIENSASVTPLLYGEFDNDILRVGGQLQIGSSDDTTAGAIYAFPVADGADGQVLTTDGAGNVNWENTPTAATSHAWYEEGTTSNPDAISDEIFTQGNVGIGDATPDNILDIEAATGDALVTITADPTNSDESHNPKLSFIQDGGGTEASLELGATGTDSNDLIFSTIASDSEFILKPNNTEKFRFTVKGQLEMENTKSSVFIGKDAGENFNLSSFGARNTLIGFQSGMSITVDSNNTAVGAHTMESGTDVDNSVAIGTYALQDVITASNTVAVGRSALSNITASSNNTAVGNNAISNTTTGDNNTAVGYKAGQNANGDSNVFIGSLAEGQGQGGNNVIIGAGAGHNSVSTALDGRIMIGFEAGSNQTTNDDLLFIENSDSNSPLIGADFAADKVGINMDLSTPSNLTHTLTVGGSVKIATLFNLEPGSAPTVPAEGDVYYDSVLKKVRVWTGAVWENLN